MWHIMLVVGVYGFILWVVIELLFPKLPGGMA